MRLVSVSGPVRIEKADKLIQTADKLVEALGIHQWDLSRLVYQVVLRSEHFWRWWGGQRHACSLTVWTTSIQRTARPWQAGNEVDILTRLNSLKKYLHFMVLTDNHIVTGVERRYPSHILCECDALASVRQQCLGEGYRELFETLCTSLRG